MSSSAPPAQFSLLDYLVLSIVLLISSAIGLYYRLEKDVLGVHFMKWHVTGDQKEKPQKDGLKMTKEKTHQAERGAPENQQ